MSRVPEAVRKELAALSAKSEEGIDFSDIPEATEKEWQGAVRGKFYRPVKKQVTIRIDMDIIEWLKSQKGGYQTRMNEILRSAMLSKNQDVFHKNR